jgi:beta-N-acetylhexosaminidase
VITDDMEMEGVLDDGKGTPSACRRALEAGNDMVLISHTPATQEQTWQYLMGALHSVPGFRAILRGDARRIVETKLRFFRAGAARPPGQAAAPSPAAVKAAVPAPGARDFFAQVSARAVTLVAGDAIPYRPGPHERILLCGQYPEFLSEGLKRFPGADTWLFPFEPFYNARPADKAAARARAASYDTVVFCLANYNSLGVLQEMKGGRARVLCLSALSPVYLSEARWLSAAVAVYGDTRDSFRAGLAVLAGDYPATGTLPVRFAGEAGG